MNSTSPIIQAAFGRLENELSFNKKHEVQIHRQSAHAKNDFHIHTFVYHFKRPINRTAFNHWLESIRSTIYRIKGYVPFDDQEALTEIQVSFGIPDYCPITGKHEPLLVFIGQDLNTEQLKRQLSEL
ncbi:CobW C-terminal domain-containing protein [Bacillus solitudinis]|uniref:GTP-binding protein n=1 Tax=Bacillus solitudinis TaxID=2014074 RepID=UPI001D0CE610